MAYNRLERILLYIIFVVVGIVYLWTVAPTVSFWDCGEFIASCYTLAVPHPPGTPFYVVLGRVWLMVIGLIASVLPISKEVAWHMNLIAITFSLFNAFLFYRLLLKIFKMWSKDENRLGQILVAFGSTLMISFFYTIWDNAVETEVYTAATAVFLLVNYLVLLWYESMKNGEPRNSYLFLSFYLIFLSSGIHLTPFLIFIPTYFFIFIVERRYLRDWLLLLSGIFQVVFFLLIYILPENLYTLGIVLLGIICLLGLVLPLNNPTKYSNWLFFWATIALVIVGISPELYLPIRSKRLTELYKDRVAQERYLKGENISPRINECEPGESFKAFDDALHRRQYGPQYMLPRKTQEKTGYSVIEGYFWQVALFIRYLSWQIAPESLNRFLRGILLTIFYGAGLWGIWELFHREKKLFSFLMFIMFMLSFAMIGYLNLKFSPSDSNPKHQEREVRERDYFFHTTDVYWGLLVGIGFYAFTNWAKKESKNNRFVKIGAYSGIIVFGIIPFFTNLHLNNRYGNFMPKDYGINMLISCDKDGIIFTNGDNDTFPLWFAQEVLGVRRDVIVANLSLINTDWYIRHLKYWGAPINFSDWVIKRLTPQMTPDRRIIYVKDIMIRHIIAVNAGIELKPNDYFIPLKEFAQKYVKAYREKRPIYFASTVSPDNYSGLEPYLKLEGLVYRLTGDSIEAPYNVDIEKTKDLFYNKFRYRGVFDPEDHNFLSKVITDFEKRKKEGEFSDFKVVKDENTERLYGNYASGLSNLGLVLQQKGDIEGTMNAWRFAMLFEIGQRFSFIYNLGLLYAQLGMYDSADAMFAQIKARDPQILLKLGLVYRSMGRYDKAIEYFQALVTAHPNNAQAYMALLSTYLEMNDTASAKRIIRQWLTINPQDTSAQSMLKELGG
ncbi:MAG: protein O-mannosyl-transferase family [bacterium]